MRTRSRSWTEARRTHILSISLTTSAAAFHIELLFPTLDLDMVADWNGWQAYNRQNEERFQRIDAGLLEEHIKIAEELQ